MHHFKSALLPSLTGFALAILMLTTEASAHEMQLQDYGMWSYYQFSHEGQPVGSVTRESWRQYFRSKYVSHDITGEPIAVARQTGLLRGRIFASNAEMSVSGADGTPLGRFVGSLWVPYAASFAVYNAHNEHVARITVDRHAQFISIRAANNWNKVLGFATRVQQATRGKDSWTLSMPDASLNIDSRIWPLVLAYFGDSWGYLALVHTEG